VLADLLFPIIFDILTPPVVPSSTTPDVETPTPTLPGTDTPSTPTPSPEPALSVQLTTPFAAEISGTENQAFFFSVDSYFTTASSGGLFFYYVVEE
jgi:hypothetical protein